MNILGVCFYKGTTNQPTWQVQWDMFKVLKFCQPTTLNHSFSSSLLSKWPNPSWIFSPFVTMHDPYLIHTFVKTLIFVFWMTLKPLLMNSMSSLERQTQKQTSNKLRSLCQGSHLNVVYTSNTNSWLVTSHGMKQYSWTNFLGYVMTWRTCIKSYYFESNYYTNVPMW